MARVLAVSGVDRAKGQTGEVPSSETVKRDTRSVRHTQHTSGTGELPQRWIFTLLPARHVYESSRSPVLMTAAVHTSSWLSWNEGETPHHILISNLSKRHALVLPSLFCFCYRNLAYLVSKRDSLKVSEANLPADAG